MVKRWLIGIMAALAFGSMSAHAQSLQLPTFVTVGLGYVVVEADQVVVSLGIETTGDTAEAAQRESERLMAAIETRLRELNLAGLRLSRRRIDIRQQRTGPIRREEGGYRATSGLDVSVARETDVGAIIDVAMGLGAASVQGVSFRSSRLEQAAKEALGLAVKDATAKAEEISRATGMRVVMIRRISDAHKVEIINPSDPVLLEAGASVRPPYHVAVQRGEILVQVEVTAEFDVAME